MLVIVSHPSRGPPTSTTSTPPPAPIVISHASLSARPKHQHIIVDACESYISSRVSARLHRACMLHETEPATVRLALWPVKAARLPHGPSRLAVIRLRPQLFFLFACAFPFVFIISLRYSD